VAVNNNDASLIAALVSAPTIEQAAEIASVSTRTAHRRLNSPEFKKALNEANKLVVWHAASRMSGASLKAVDTLEELLQANSESVRLQAARTILELGARLREGIDLELRIKALEESLKIRLTRHHQV
jgi:hypothetical protein